MTFHVNALLSPADASLDPTAEVNEDEVLSEDSLLLQTEGKANNGEAFGSDEDLLATPVSKTAPQQITDKLPLTATDLSVSAKGQEKAAGQPAKQALSQEPKTPDAGKKSKTKVTMSGQAGAETNGTGGAIKAASKALSVEEVNMQLGSTFLIYAMAVTREISQRIWCVYDVACQI